MLELNSEQKEYTTTTLLNNENTKFELKTCGTGQNDVGIDSVKAEEYTAVLENSINLDSIARAYFGVLPTNVETNSC